MKVFITVLFSLLVFAISNAQSYSYVPLPLDSGNYWRESGSESFGGSNGSCFNFQHKVERDTLINGKVYAIIRKVGLALSWPSCSQTINPINERVGMLRNDTAAQAVYYLNPAIGINQDTLLYDFDLQVGDTLQESYLTNGFDHIVVGLDTLLIDGKLRERYLIDDLCQGSNDPVYLIEGIGSNGGLLFELTCALCFSNDLLCVSEPAKTIYPDSSFSCDLVTSLSDLDKGKMDLIIHPNPTNGRLNLTTKESLSQIEIYNLQGQKVMELNPAQKAWIVEGLKTGLYFLKATDDEGNFHTKKFVKH